jgi:hypothetical protein
VYYDTDHHRNKIQTVASSNVFHNKYDNEDIRFIDIGEIVVHRYLSIIFITYTPINTYAYYSRISDHVQSSSVLAPKDLFLY